MAYVTEEIFIKSSSSIKEIDMSPRRELDSLMKTIYEEAPWKWPYGLSADSHDAIYMVRSASTSEPVGFVGWQERNEGASKIGYYTIGVLPEHRGQGKAKEALSQLLMEKSATVDQVKAFIVEGNHESKRLAKSLDIPFIVKVASFKDVIKAVAPYAAYGVGTPILHDAVQAEYRTHNSGRSFSEEYGDTSNSGRWTQGGLNALFGLGAAGVHVGAGAAGKAIKGALDHDAAPMSAGSKFAIGLSAGAPAAAGGPVFKDLALNNMNVGRDLATSIKGLKTEPSPEFSDTQKNLALGAAGLGATGILAGAIGLYLNSKKKEDKGRIRVTLPTKNPGDAETTVEIPMQEGVNLSNTAYGRINTDFKKQILGELRERREIRKQVEQDEAKKAQKKMALLGSEVENLNVMQKAAGQLPGYDPMVGQANQQLSMPQGAPASMAYSKVAPYSQSNLPPEEDPTAGDDEMHDAEKLEKKLETLEKENIELKIQQKAQEIAEKQSAKAPTDTTPQVDSGLESKLNNLKQTISGISKMAASVNYNDPVRKLTPKDIDMSMSETANKKVNGNPGIQMPVNYKPVYFGKETQKWGGMLKKTLLPAQPTARGMFMEDTPPQTGWPERILQLWNAANSANTGYNPTSNY